jgi:hypothetical protein
MLDCCGVLGTEDVERDQEDIAKFLEDTVGGFWIKSWIELCGKVTVHTGKGVSAAHGDYVWEAVDNLVVIVVGKGEIGHGPNHNNN